ncbi:hypothetical protein PC9H_006464 [Pleurotus ostreatus]|uniref:Uncharacterized protein n=2 Tax=Pleurotus ostreatus TaxID=5322 RepID=A0A067NRQ6_PLEO1|nr:uncharacterized protein PC9H_006464 [Pleurotus ostreatus]KAF7430753.1 hypothetical protein PC9H_006464 [Pleurotus ostreatus]KAJ8695099.1 hypothetical protein PTI98_007716 [Pleurotus ostreatus]KDQ26772.1 hypothetical protein PLEOSDRAFT_159312 [Pleurotus ostreatus PC15]
MPMQARFRKGAHSPPATHDRASVRPAPSPGPQPRRQGGVVLDGLDGALNVLRAVGPATQIPYVREAAGVLLQIVNIIQAVRDNQDEFKRLIIHAAEILTRLEVVWKDQRSKRVSNELHASLKKLYSIVIGVQAFVEEITRRSRFKRTICCKSDLVRIQIIKDDLNNCLEYFKVDALIITNQEIVQLMKNMTLLQRQFHEGHSVCTASSHASPISSPSTSSLESTVTQNQSIYTNPHPNTSGYGEVIALGSGNDCCLSHLTLVPTPDKVVYPPQQSTSHAEDQANNASDTESAKAPEGASPQAIEVPDHNEM